MALDARQRQKNLAKKLAKRKEQLNNKRPKSRIGESYSFMRAAHFPIHECLVPVGLFENGIGTVILSRALPNGDIALAAFLVDAYCLGVKNALSRIVSPQEYSLFVDEIKTNEKLDRIHPSCLRKLVKGAIHYAQELGFGPHSDYGLAAKLFGDIDATVCPESYVYGKDGQPLYISGPNESPAQSRRIINALTRRLGSDGFKFITTLGTDEEEIEAIKLGGKLKEVQYEITTESLENTGYARLPEPVKDQIGEIFDDIGRLPQDPKIIVAKVQPLLEQYPDVPQLYNYLHAAYRFLGDQTNADRVIEETLRRFPDYLFGRLAHAERCLRHHELDKVPEIFENKYDLKLMYPNRNRFHISEVVNFNAIMAWYFHERGNRAQSEVYYRVLSQLAPDHQSTQMIKRMLYPKGILGRLRNKLISLSGNIKPD